MMRRAALVGGAFLCIGLATAAENGASPSEPEGYRLEEYRTPTPATLRGARVLKTPEAEAVWRNHSAAFIDVLPQAPRPVNLPAGTLWRDKPRPDIPGSIWLPDTGYGELASVTLDYLRPAAAPSHARRWKRTSG